MWQKAKIIKSQLFPHAIGKCVWVWEEPPKSYDYVEIVTGENNSAPCYVSNLLDERNARMVMPQELVRLLDEKMEWVQDVPYETWAKGDWRGCE